MSRETTSPDEISTAFDGPAICVNRILLTEIFGGIRLAFLEGAGDIRKPVFRTGVFLSYADAISLRDLITDAVGPREDVE